VHILDNTHTDYKNIHDVNNKKFPGQVSGIRQSVNRTVMDGGKKGAVKSII
jgi:hypothetical protein